MVKAKQWQSSTNTMTKANQMYMAKGKQWQLTIAKAMVAFYGKNNSILWKCSASLWLMQFYANVSLQQSNAATEAAAALWPKQSNGSLLQQKQ